MASKFADEYLKKRREQQTAQGNTQQASGAGNQSDFVKAYLGKRYAQDIAKGTYRSGGEAKAYFAPKTGRAYSTGTKKETLVQGKTSLSPETEELTRQIRAKQSLERAKTLQAQADQLNKMLLREPQKVGVPDYSALDAEQQAKSDLETYGIRRQEAANALKAYQKQYGAQMDQYGPFLDAGGSTIERGMAARQMEYDQANQAYEDAFADYQKKQQAAQAARAQENQRKNVQRETALYNEQKNAREQANEAASKAWSSYYTYAPSSPDYKSKQQDPYTRSSYEERMDKITSNKYSDEDQIRDLVMTDDELALMTYLRNTQGEDAARRYYDSLGLDSRLEDYQLGQMAEFGQRNPVSASVLSTMYNVANEAAGTAGIAKAKLTGQEITGDADYFKAGKMRDALREGVMSDMGPIGRFVYQTGMSAVADSTINGVLGGGTGVLTGLSAMVDGVREAKENGYDDTRAMTQGIIAGILENATEKMGFDRVAGMLKREGGKTLSRVLREIGSHMANEAMEEGATTVLNQIADGLYGALTGQEREFTRLRDGYMGDGMGEMQATLRALNDLAENVTLDAAGGALGGLMMGGGATALNQAFNAVAEYQYNKASQEAAEAGRGASAGEPTPTRTAPQNGAQEASPRVLTEAERRAQERIAALAMETADEELGVQSAAAQTVAQAENRVRMTGGEQAAVRNAARVYGKDAGSFESHYAGGNVNQYRKAFDQVYQAGKVNLSLEQVNKTGGELVRGLSDQAKLEIWQAGRNNALNTTVAGVNRQYTQAMNSEQRAQVRLLDEIGKKYGVQIDVVDSLDYGNTRANAATVGKNHIVVAADAMEHAYVQAGVHELVHVLKNSSDDAYQFVSDLVVDTLKNSGMDVQTEVAQRIEEYAQQGVKLTQEEALEEIVAESVPVVLSNREAMKTFVQQNRTLAEKIRDFFVDFAKTIEELAEKYFWQTERKEVAAMLLADTQELTQIAEALDYALSAVAEENAQRAVADNATTETERIEAAGIGVSDEGTAYPASTDVMYSLRTLSESDYVKERDKAAAALSKKLDVDLAQAQKYIDDLTSVGAIIAADKARLDFEAEGEYSSLKPNSEYKWTVDMSTLCAKRLVYTGTFDAIQAKLNNEILTADDYIQLRNMMAERGYEVACAFCYVESRRKDNGRIISEFLKVYREAQESGKKMALGPSNRRKEFSVEAGFTPTIADFNTTKGALNILHNHKGVYDAYMYFMNARGTSKPKLIETRTEYNNEILNKFRTTRSVNAMNRRGGLRLQSFSDFEVVNLLDMMQITYDMSRAGLASQAYTKVPAFARVFGGTGIKINESLVTSGVDENGQLIFDDVEGMPHEEAFRIREMYPENVGTILVGRDDASILAAMEDPRIDFIIPYHRNGWSANHMNSLGISGYTDYTKYQNETRKEGKGKISNFFPLGYWDFSKSGDENAEIYLKKCEESGRVPKFPQFAGKRGYWKMLIDFKMYDNAGNGSPQRAVRPDINMEEARKVLAEYKGGHSDLPIANDVVRDFIAWREGQQEARAAEEQGDVKFSLMSKREYAQFYSKVGEMKAGKSAQFHVSPDGDYVFDIENKLVYTDGKWMEPEISKVVAFDLEDGTELDAAKACFVECEDGGIGYERIQDILTGIFGKEVASIRLGTLRGQTARENRRGTGGSLTAAGEGNRGDLSAEGERRASLNSREAEEDVRFSLVNASKVENAINEDKNLALPEDVEIDVQAVQSYARAALRAANNSQGKTNQQLKQIAGLILKSTGSRYKRADLVSNLRAVVEEYAKNGPSAEVTRQITEMSKAIIEGSGRLDNSLREQYADLRQRMREAGVTLSENQKKEAARRYGSYKDYRDRLMGTVTLRKDGTLLDSVWGELSGQYPEIFDPSTNDADQIDALIEFKQLMEPTYINDFGMDLDGAATDLGLRIQADLMGVIGAKEASKSLYGMKDSIERKYKSAYDAQLKAQKQDRVKQFQQISREIASAKKAKDDVAYQEAMKRYRKLSRTEIERRVESISVAAERAQVKAAQQARTAQFREIQQALAEAKKAKDENAYRAALDQYRNLAKKGIEKRVAALAVADVKAQVKASMQVRETERRRQVAAKRVANQANRLLGVLGNQKKDVRVPRVLQDTVLGLLESIDINGKRAAKEGKETAGSQIYRYRLQALREQYQQIWDSQSKGEAPEELHGLMMTLDEHLLESIDEATKMLERGDTFTLRTMELEQLNTLDELLGNVRHTIESIGRLWRNRRYQSTVALGDQSIRELGVLKDQRFNETNGATIAAGRDLLAVDMMEPVSYGERLGSAGSAVIESLYEGERVKFARLREAQAHIENMLASVDVTSYDVGKWKTEFHTFRLEDGHVVRMSVPQIMDVYNAQRRPSAMQHMLGGGMKLATVPKGGRAQIFTAKLTSGDIDQITSVLTSKQRRLAMGMQQYLATTVAKWGNDVTQELYLYDYFTDPEYWPITSDPHALKTDEPRSDLSLTAITSPGWMKALNPKASNPLVVRDAFDVFNQHVAEMASYSGLAMPIMDTLSYLNYKQHDEDGQITGGVRESIERALGKGGRQYLINLIADLNHARKGDDVAQLSKLSSLYKKSAVVGKIRVTIQQPTAIARAAQEISPVYLAMGLKLNNKQDIREMQEYSSLAWWKSNGSGSDIGVGSGADRVLWGDLTRKDTVMEKVNTAGGLIDPGKADDVTWAAMWRAVKRETARLHPELGEGSTDFFRAVAERFDAIMDKTQVVDSVMHRSQIMRSTNGMMRELTSFMAEPIKSYNMLARAGIDLSRAPASKKAQSGMVRAGVVFAANAALTALATALFDVFKYRDDDDDLWAYLTDAKNGFLPEYLGEFTDAFLDNFNVIELVPILRDAVDAVTKGESPEIMGFEGVASLYTAADTFKDHFVDGNKKHTTAYGAVAPVLKSVSMLTGLPVAGMMANIEMLAKIADPQALKYKLRDGTLEADYESLYRAIKEGDKDKQARIRARLGNEKLGGSAKSAKEIDRGVAYVLADQDERVMQAYKLRQAGNQTGRLLALKKEIMADGFSDAIVTAAINRCEKLSEEQSEPAEKDLTEELAAKMFGYDDLYNVIRNGTLEDVAVVSEYLEAHSSAKDPAKTAKSNAGSEFKPEYVDGIMAGRDMSDLKAKLMSLGYDEADLADWIKDARYDELSEAVGDGDTQDARAYVQQLQAAGTKTQNIVTSLNSRYKDTYIELVMAGKTAEANTLQRTLEGLGLVKEKTGENYFRKSYMDSWVEDYRKEQKK